MTAQVIELNRDHRLAKLANQLHREVDKAVKVWWDIGLLLSEARKEFPGDREFGQWIKWQGFKLNNDTLAKYRLAWEFASDHDRVHIGNDYHVVHRIAHMPELQQAEVLERIEAGEQFTRNKLNKEYPTKAKPNRGEAEMQRAMAAADDARSGLSISNQRKIDAAIKAERKKLDVEYARKFEEEVMITRQKQEEASEERLLFQKKSRGIKPLMSKQEYRMVVSCLHPDRARDKTEEVKLNKALAIFQKLEPLLK